MPEQMNTPEARARALATRTTTITVHEMMQEPASLWPVGQTAKIRSRLEEMPPHCRKRYLRAMQGKSRKAAIEAQCSMCFGWENIAANVRGCTDPACPMYPYRPFQE